MVRCSQEISQYVLCIAFPTILFPFFIRYPTTQTLGMESSTGSVSSLKRLRLVRILLHDATTNSSIIARRTSKLLCLAPNTMHKCSVGAFHQSLNARRVHVNTYPLSERARCSNLIERTPASRYIQRLYPIQHPARSAHLGFRLVGFDDPVRALSASRRCALR